MSDTPKKKPDVNAPIAASADEISIGGKGMFEIKRTANGGYMFNVRAGNKQVVATSQTYTTMTACRGGINSVGMNAPLAAIEDLTLSTVNEEKCPKFQIYLDKVGEFRFKLLAANGQNVLACSQGYAHKSSCKNGIKSVINNAHATIVMPEIED